MMDDDGWFESNIHVCVCVYVYIYTFIIYSSYSDMLLCLDVPGWSLTVAGLQLETGPSIYFADNPGGVQVSHEKPGLSMNIGMALIMIMGNYWCL